MKELILILTVMLSVGCERTIDNRIEHLEASMMGLRSENCALTNKIYQQEYDSCVAFLKATEEVNQSEHRKKIGKEIERLIKLVRQDVKNNIVILPLNDRGYSGAQCFRMSPENCGD